MTEINNSPYKLISSNLINLAMKIKAVLQKRIVFVFLFCILIIGISAFFLLIKKKGQLPSIYLAGQSALGSSFFNNCRNTDNYSTCWKDTQTSCALVVNLDNNTIDDTAFCNTAGTCKFKGRDLACTQSLNPIQNAVDIVSERNQTLSKIRYEVFLEPGEFTVEQTCFDGALDPSCSGFVRKRDNEIVRNYFGHDRFAVQVPSFTQITGSLVNNKQQSIIYIPERIYDVWGDFKDKPFGYKGGGVGAIFTLTNVLGIASQNLTEEKATLYNPSMQNPVNNVIIQNLYLLGVGGPSKKNQQQGMPTYYYCSDPECYYRYTAYRGISGKRISGGNVKILNNKMEFFVGFIALGHFFNMSDSSYPQDLLGEKFITQLRADGLADDKILIADNYFDKAIEADSIIVWGSHIKIANNTIRNGLSDWYGNQLAISVYADSEDIVIANNIIQNYATPVNLEGLIPVAAAYTNQEAALWKETPRIAKNNLVVDNTMDNALVCVAVQRQSGAKVLGNKCSFNQQKWEKLIDFDYYSPASKNDFLRGFFGEDFTQKEAQNNNSEIMGSGVHIRTSEYSEISQNVFHNFPRGFFLDYWDILNNGMYNNEINENVFDLPEQQAQHNIALANDEGIPDTFYGMYKVAHNNAPASKNRLCSNNQFQYSQNSGRLYSENPLPGWDLNADCGSVSSSAMPTIPQQTTPVPKDVAPIGWLDTVDCNSFIGWAGDIDNPHKPIEVHFYADGPAGVGKFLGSITANLAREEAVCLELFADNCDVCNTDTDNLTQCLHGFSFETPLSLKDNQVHSIYPYAINLPGTVGDNAQLWSSPKEFVCPPISP